MLENDWATYLAVVLLRIATLAGRTTAFLVVVSALLLLSSNHCDALKSDAIFFFSS